MVEAKGSRDKGQCCKSIACTAYGQFGGPGQDKVEHQSGRVVVWRPGQVLMCRRVRE